MHTFSVGNYNPLERVIKAASNDSNYSWCTCSEEICTEQLRGFVQWNMNGNGWKVQSWLLSNYQGCLGETGIHDSTQFWPYGMTSGRALQGGVWRPGLQSQVCAFYLKRDDTDGHDIMTYRWPG